MDEEDRESVPSHCTDEDPVPHLDFGEIKYDARNAYNEEVAPVQPFYKIKK